MDSTTPRLDEPSKDVTMSTVFAYTATELADGEARTVPAAPGAGPMATE
jgi:hypothetical protein